jgi:predicted peroxiredoxin
MRGLTLILAVPEPSRFHAALSVAAASAATGAATRLYLHGDAVALLASPVSQDDGRYHAAGLPTLALMLGEALGLGVTLICCQTGLALAGLEADAIDPQIEVGGLVGLLATLGDDRLVMV